MASNPTFTSEEQAFASQVLALADPKKLGIVPGDVAVKIFAGSNIPADTLGDIWQLADQENNGFLTRKGLGIALRLMSHVQFGEELDEKLISKPAPPPTIQGVTPLPASSAPTTSTLPAPSTPRPVPPIPSARPSAIQTLAFPPITAEDRGKFTRIFAQGNPVNGLLSGEKARDVFLKSKLPFETLGAIWNLADTQSRGSLDLTDFILGMYFIQSTMNQSLPVLPSILPPGLYEQASGGRVRVASPAPISPISRQSTGQQPVKAHMTGGSLQSVSSPGLNSQFPHQATSLQRTGTIARVNSVPTGSAFPLAPQRLASQSWDITSTEKGTADRFFASLDTAGRGYITGDIAVPFMLDSKLPENTLAHIWDLADMDHTGQLDRDCFAVALHLINGQLAGVDVPATLPLSLVPPSKREQPPQAAPKTVDDLFSLMDDTPSIPPNVGQQQPFGPPPMQPQVTGHRPPFSPAPALPPADLMGDDVPEAAMDVSDRSVDIGNLQNQLASTQRSLANAKGEREPLEKKIADYASQIAQLESQLSLARASHDTETRLLSDLRSRSSAQSEQMRTLKEDLIRAESELSAIRIEKAEIETALLRDKEDVRDMQKRMKVISDETDKAKAESEKAKNDARLQKGLVAIAKKQLATAEADKLKAMEALAASQKELDDARKEAQEAEAVAAAATASAAAAAAVAAAAQGAEPPFGVLSPTLERSMAIPLPETPGRIDSPSPLAPAQKSNNPFDRLTKGLSPGMSTPRSAGGSQPFGASVTPQHTGLAVTTVASEQRDAQTEEGAADSHSTKPEQPSEAGQSTEDGIQDPFAISSDSRDQLQLSMTDSFDDAFGSSEAGPITSVVAAADSVETQYHTSDPLTARASEPEGDALQEAQAHFPALEDFPKKPLADGADLPPLRELPAAEEDSSDESEPSIDQGTAKDLVAAVIPSAQERLMDDMEPFGSVPGPAMEESSSVTTPHAQSTISAFDDAFGDASTPTPRLKTPTPNDSVLPPAEHLSDASQGEPMKLGGSLQAPQAASSLTHNSSSTDRSSFAVGDFDEALDQMPSSGTTDGGFKFDSAFGDSFDFASESTLTPAPLSVTNVNGHVDTTAHANPRATVDDFDTLFAGPPPMPVRNGTGATQSSTAPSLSFDDAFVVAPPPAPSPQPSRAESTRSIFAANMVSPMNPPRKKSPKSKSLILNPNMPAVFHSNLAPPPARLSDARSTTPAVADDVEGVKQLCGMGFSRSQAVEALEKYGYDVSKALNSLLS